MFIYDIAIVGAGPIGVSAALAFSDLGFSVLLIEKNKKKEPAEDGRGYALSQGTVNFLNKFGVFRGFEHVMSPIKSIEVTELGSMQHLCFEEEDYHGDAMGYLVESHHVQAALSQYQNQYETLYETEVMQLKHTTGYVELVTAGGTYKSRLIVACDGKKSGIRDLARISTFEKKYPYPALVARVSHEIDHGGRAHEIFMTQGLLALLPQKPNISSVVWCMNPDQLDVMLKAPAEIFETEMMKIFDHYGQYKLVGERFAFPLTAILSDRLVANRLALLGDAAQSIHPVAGQGLNLGFRGLINLYDRLKVAKKLGLDPGSDTLLHAFEKEYVQDRTKFYHMTNGLLGLYELPNRPFKLIRSAGLGFVNLVKPLKRAMIAEAMGKKSA